MHATQHAANLLCVYMPQVATAVQTSTAAWVIEMCMFASVQPTTHTLHSLPFCFRLQFLSFGSVRRGLSACQCAQPIDCSHPRIFCLQTDEEAERLAMEQVPEDDSTATSAVVA